MPKLSPEDNKIRKFDRVMGLAIGRPGKGKSIGLSSFPKPMKLYDLDGRIKAIENFGSTIDGEIDYETYNDPKDYPKLKDSLKNLVLNCKYQTVIIDGYTALADMLIGYSISLRGSSDTDSKGKQKGVIQMTTIEDFGAEAQELSHIIGLMRLIRAPFRFMTAHMLLVEYYDPMTKQNKILKSVLTAGKKITEKVPGYFDEVWLFDTDDNMNPDKPPSYRMRTIPQEGDMVKTTLQLPTYVDFTKGVGNPNGSLYSVICKELKSKGWEV